MLSERWIRETVRRAIKLIETEGFRRGKRGKGYCVGDAVSAADPKKKYRWTVWARIESLICQTTKMRHGGHYSVIARWNDKPGRTKEEAIALLRRVEKHDYPFCFRDSRGVVYGPE